MTDDELESLSSVADTLDNLCHALMLPLPATVHVEQFKLALPGLIVKLREVYVAQAGDDPWS